MKCFGSLRDMHNETVRIDRIVENEFNCLEPADWL